MLAILIIILVLLGAAVVGSIYSNFMVFYSNFSETENYHKAYYASISALERAELVIKQRQPGYVGSGGFIDGIGTGSFSGSDKSLSGFSYFGTNTGDTSVVRIINSRATRIPELGGGDVEPMLSTGIGIKHSKNYNMMNYEDAQVFLLYYDKSDNNPYTGCSTIVPSSPSSISGEIRLPLLLQTGFGLLDTGNALVGQTNSLPADDAIVDWQIRGKYTPFTIYSTQSITVGGSSPIVEYTKDSVFRESDINKTLNFKFGNSRSPITGDRGKYIITTPTIISPQENGIITSNYYKNIFSKSGIELRFGLLNLLQGSGTNIYPFLEYFVNFGTGVSDKYFTINAEGKFKDYKVNTIIKKPTIKESVFGNFTSIF